MSSEETAHGVGTFSDLVDVAPSAARLIGSLRDIGYDFPTAIADIVDNSVSAGAQNVGIELAFIPDESYVLVWDDGVGMSESQLNEAFRFGSRRDYEEAELGRFGLGLKTGSFSQCRRLTVMTRPRGGTAEILSRTLDLDHVESTDQWVIQTDQTSPAADYAEAFLREAPGTVVLWEKLDRVLPERFAESGWGRRRLANLARKTSEHLGLVFHRFLSGSHGLQQLHITVNGLGVEPWDPFAQDEQETISGDPEVFEIEVEGRAEDVVFRGYVLPSRDRFSSTEAFERLSGPLKWNRQQGLYIYRANRVVQYGGWNGTRGIDEHTKLARASIDFGTGLDEAFQVNVAKMRVVLPAQLKKMLGRPIHELCVRADAVYRQAASLSASRSSGKTGFADGVALREVGIAMKAALLESGGLEAFESTIAKIREHHPELASSLDL